ncbi:LytR/AlgR family response regulator transcription factor [Kosakonia oryzae]|uniref:DNA-binding response regulator, LytR/AlgR family n=1 Tax=Kosakonia oryzae TaxID=497725 RepID=A0AA94KNK9_9ENTR|nr:LytTR family DNA-binding domain-containing protein [Kosakonia oryzae]ANI84333.1 response regulator transcription factor [Kosakonia oryzae]UDJ81448.1 response regulator transcription factor [Kosakonia oryzae]SFB67600.1 DNA-binding response regulator, LytR/AlgR family [Kosakonia oryzae]
MTKNITAIIADDEPLLRYQLNKMLADVWPELDILASCENGKEAFDAIAEEQPDIAFLDIRMPEMDGMTLIRRISQLDKFPLVVFVTAYDEYAVRAFETNAIDYLLKPLNEKRLEQCVLKMKQRLSETTADKTTPDLNALFEKFQSFLPVEHKSYLKWVRVQKGEDIELIHCSDIQFFKAEDKYISLYKKNKTQSDIFLLRGSLRELLLQLDPDEFWQVHRSVVVNVNAIEKIKRDCTGKIQLIIGGHVLQVSRAMQNKFLYNI